MPDEPRSPTVDDPTPDTLTPGDPTDLTDLSDSPEATGAADDADTAGTVSTQALSDADIRDALPDDLNAAGYVGPYLFPNNSRRRVPAILYWVISALCLALYLATRNSDPVLVNAGFLAVAIGLTLFGAYSFVAGWDLKIDERDALVAATKQVGFPVGHASAQMGWRGVLSRPTWRILLYSAEDPPDRRGLVLIDGVDGSVVEWFVEDNPEDWSELK